MKKNILLIAILITSYSAIAGVGTQSIRTSNGNLVSVGDSYVSVVSNLGGSPVSTRSYEVEDRDYPTDKHALKKTVTEFIYLIDNIYYTITIVNDRIENIVWDRQS